MAAQQSGGSPEKIPLLGRLLPFDSGAEEELATSMSRAPFRIRSDGTPSLEFKRFGRDTIAVHMSSKIVGTDASSAGFSFEVGPLREETARYNLSGVEVKLVGVRGGSSVIGHVSSNSRAISFYPVEVGETYTFEFGDSLGVLALPPRPQPYGGDGPLKAREKPPKAESEDFAFPGGSFAGAGMLAVT